MSERVGLQYEFGPFLLDPSEPPLLRGGKRVHLPVKAFETLVVLVENSGRLVGKDQLFEQLWPDTNVEKGNLDVNISALRKALGDSGGGSQYIETVPRRGYRFTGEVRRVQAGDANGHTDAINSLAVLPLVNDTNDPSAEYLSDGITESIINTLSQLPQLRVMARSTAFRYKGSDIPPREAGREMGVRAVLSGRVLQVGDRLVIRAELVDVAGGWQLWGAQYDRRPADILAVQSEIAREISEGLRLKLSGEEKERLVKQHTESTEAYRTYLKGRYYWNKRTLEGLKRGSEFFGQAIAIDERYALAYAGVADSFLLLGSLEYGALHPTAAMRRPTGRDARLRDRPRVGRGSRLAGLRQGLRLGLGGSRERVSPRHRA